ncbi:aminoglycoside phosphotransferase family protein [Streptomyces aureoverticillatus]|uniref:aminoglycoside phosphotransferase family protein n=1 Tax=Streptomyces aureoverticillatus TaxID=66871 RepID=UPI0013D9E2F6|nr:aminoglycoside phosphotransferase family protein [Streptomyces aureoverticillatus]QIB44994.1 aminoglycoside phosphotransferase family protein [Streptomyces aureoverticillatus]
MPTEATPAAQEDAARASSLVGPFKGYHNETYVLRLPGGKSGQGKPWCWKFKEPRDSILWFDRRCFDSEEQLLEALAGRVTWIPEVKKEDGFRLQRFVEGRTLGASVPRGSALPEALIDQIITLFREMARIAPRMLTVKRRCAEQCRAPEGDTNQFLEVLIRFTERDVYMANRPRFGGLFAELGIGQESFEALRARMSRMVSRPFCLLHGDLHRENFIVDPQGQLWTIDWELAMFGDPLYDLATHLHLMGYAPEQANEVTRRWSLAVEEVLPGSSVGYKEDLDSLLDYKRAQSVFTDVIRTAQMLDTATDQEGKSLGRAVGKVHGVLAAAVDALGLGAPPSHERVEAALERWLQRQGRAPRS